MIQVSPYCYDAAQAQVAIDYANSEGGQSEIDLKLIEEDRYPIVISFTCGRTVWTCIAQAENDPDEEDPSLEGHLSGFWNEEIDAINPDTGWYWGGQLLGGKPQDRRNKLAKFFEL